MPFMLAVAAAMVLVDQASALAQASQAGMGGPPRSPAVFQGARPVGEGDNSLTLATSALGGYDTNIFATAGGGSAGGGNLGSTSQSDSTFGAVSTSLQWRQTGPRASYFGGVDAGYRAYFDVDDLDAVASAATGGFRFSLTPKSSVGAEARASVQPFYQFSLIGDSGPINPGVPTGPSFTPDFQAGQNLVLRYSYAGDYSYRFSPRLTFSAQGSAIGFHPLEDIESQAQLSRADRWWTGARLTYQATTNLAARVGYGYGRFGWRQAPLATDVPTSTPIRQAATTHNIDAGVNYSRALTVARRTYFSFGTGSTILQQGVADADGDLGTTRFDVTGFATLSRQFLRTWNTSLSYVRGIQYIEGYNDVGLFDTVSVGAVGLLSDRLDLSGGAAYSDGRASRGRGDRIATLSAGTQLRYAISQNVAAFVSYTYAWFDIPPDRRPVSAPTFQPERQGVRVGLTLWLDLKR